MKEREALVKAITECLMIDPKDARIVELADRIEDMIDVKVYRAIEDLERE